MSRTFDFAYIHPERMTTEQYVRYYFNRYKEFVPSNYAIGTKVITA